MDDLEKLRVLLPHWVEHNGEHAGEFRTWAERAGPAQALLLEAARLMDAANAQLEAAVEALGGPLEHAHTHHDHPH